jgi:transposase
MEALMATYDTRFNHVDVLPMVKYYLDELKICNLLNKYVPSENCLVDHAQALCILITNIICANRPLYKVFEWLSPYADGLVGGTVNSSVYNDDRLGRSLDVLFVADRHSMMTELAIMAIKVHQLVTDELHNDSTSITFTGKYKNPDPDAVKLKHGKNKDFRPDCKQIVFGLNITNDGHVPLSYNLWDGNTTDDVTHIPNWDGLRSLLNKEDFIYIADCKLCSKENLAHIAGNNGFFITIIPKDRKEVKKFYKLLKKYKIKWKPAYEVEDSRKKGKKIIYSTYEADITKQGYRAIFVHSSGKQEEDKKRRNSFIEKAFENLEELAPKLNKYHLKTKKEIQAKVDSICKSTKNFINVKVVTMRKQIKVKVSPGRPGCKTVYKNKWDFTYRIEWELNEESISEAIKQDGIFPLITNTEIGANEVLKAYKRQPFLEKRMYTKKSILEVAPVFLKKEKRIEAMLFLFFVALMFVSLIERQIRQNMIKETIEKLPILPQGMNSKKPTWNNIRYFFREVHLSQILKNDVQIQINVKGISDLHKEILRLLSVPVIVYENLSVDWWQFKNS